MGTRVPRFRLNSLIIQLQNQGWRTKETRLGHYQFFPPNGGPIFHMSDNARMWRRNMSDLKRAGFDQLAEAMEQAKQPEQTPPHPAPVITPEPQLEAEPVVKKPVPMKGQMQTYISDILRAHPERSMQMAEISPLVLAKYDTTYGSVNATLALLARKGVLYKEGKGLYRWLSGAPRGTAPKLDPKVAPRPTAAPLPIAGARTGDMTIDKALERLDNGLAALADLAEVVGWVRQQLIATAELKSVLEKFK